MAQAASQGYPTQSSGSLGACNAGLPMGSIAGFLPPPKVSLSGVTTGAFALSPGRANAALDSAKATAGLPQRPWARAKRVSL